MASAEPTNLQWVFVLVVMGVDCFDAADLAGLLFQFACLQRSLHRQMGVVFCRVCSAPVRLSRPALDHDVGPVMLFRAYIVEGNARGGLRRIPKHLRSTISNYASLKLSPCCSRLSLTARWSTK